MWALQNKQAKQGFTIVELLIVIVVIAILAAIIIVSYNGIRNQAGVAYVKSDLSSLAKQLENAKTISGTQDYPSEITSYDKADDITYQYTPTGTTFCLTATSTYGNFYISSTNMNPVEGVCVGHSENPEAAAVWGNGTVDTLALSQLTTCTVHDNQAYCWGYSSSAGQLGDGTTSPRNHALATNPVSSLSNVTYVGRGVSHACAISDADAYCWGNNGNGKLGNGTTTNAPTPMQVDTVAAGLGELEFTAIEGGGNFTCALAEGWVYCWGWRGSGQTGDGSSANYSRTLPAAIVRGAIPTGVTIEQLSVGYSHACVLGSDSNVYCWGTGSNGQLSGSTGSTGSPRLVEGLLSGRAVSAIAAGGSHSCAITDGELYCWGRNNYGQLGSDSAGADVLSPVKVSGLLDSLSVTQVAAGGYYASQATCALAGGEAYCWGRNNQGQGGTGSTSPSMYSTPAKVGTSGVLSGVSLGAIGVSPEGTVCASGDGNIYCWGRGSEGQLGNNNSQNSSNPVLVTKPAAFE